MEKRQRGTCPLWIAQALVHSQSQNTVCISSHVMCSGHRHRPRNSITHHVTMTMEGFQFPRNYSLDWTVLDFISPGLQLRFIYFLKSLTWAAGLPVILLAPLLAGCPEELWSQNHIPWARQVRELGGQWTREESNLQVCFPLQSVSMAMVHANCLAWVHLKEVGNTLPIQLDSYQIECRIESFMNHESESSVGYRAAPHPTDFGFGSLACLLCVCPCWAFPSCT